MGIYPLLIHLPHSSTNIPEEIRRDIILNEQGLKRESLLITDRYTDELYEYEGAFYHKNNYSRLVFDPERFRDDERETMAKVGMGAVYTRTSTGDALRNISQKKRLEMIETYYDPYHRKLTQKIDEIVGKYGKCTILDGHSFPDTPLMFERNTERPRPDICIGSDLYHTPEKIVLELERFIHRSGYSTDRNFPFSGALVPMKFYGKNKSIMSVMIEINRRLYMEEISGEKSSTFRITKSFIRSLIEFIVEITCG